MQWLVVNLRLAFAVFVITGGAFIFALSRIARDSPSGSAANWILVSAILGLMVIFGIVVWVRSRTQHAADTDAETFYYLGFIYTLLTLVAAFTPLLAEGSKPSTQQVLGLFGLGLITTFFGLAGRVFFLQSRAGETLDSNIDRLSRASAEAARSLDSTALQISKIGSELERVALKSQELLLASIEKATERFAARSQQLFEEANSRIIALTDGTGTYVDQTLRAATERLAAVLDVFASKVAALKLPPSELGERLNERVTALIQAADNASNAASAFGSKLTATNKELSGLAPGLASANAGLANLATTANATAKGLGGVEPALEQFAVTTKAATGELASVQKSTKDLGATMERLAANAAHVTPALIQAAETASVFAGKLNATNEELSRLAPGLDSVTGGFADLTTTVNSTTKGIGEVGPGLEQLAVTTKATTTELASAQKSTKDFGATMERLAADAAQATPALSKLSEDVAEAAGQFSKLVSALSGAETSAAKLTEAQKLSAHEMLRATKALETHHDAMQQLVNELLQDLKASEEAVRKVHGNLIAATEFLTAKVQ